MSRVVKVGDPVYAKWPGSSKFYEAVVKEIGETKCLVDFKDELETEIPIRDVYNISYFQKRPKSASPSRRGRSRSPGRRRSRSRSPARRRSPAPSSPSPKPRGRSPGRPRKILKEVENPEEEPEKKPEEKPEEKPRRSPGRPRKILKEVENPTEKAEEKKPAESKPKETPKPTPETPTRVTRSLTKTLIKEEKEALLSPLMEDEEKEKARKSGKREYEFGGPLGAFIFILGLPVLVYCFHFYCSGKNGQCSFQQKGIKLPDWKVFFNKAHLVYDAWLLFHVLLYLLPIGRIVKGPQLADGSQLDYRINGIYALLATIALFFALMANKIPLTYVYDNLTSIMTATVMWSVVISVFLYIKARMQGTGLAPTGNTGNAVYDFFMGHQLNPRIGNFDFKFFFELRPGLLGWVMLNFCMAIKEAEQFGSNSPAMILVCAFQFVYVADCLLFEASMLTTIDMFHEGFGYMLAFGDITFVPFMYSLQARFLADHQVNLHWAAIVGIVVLKVVGYVIFRGSNLQKDFFRQHPEDEEFQDKETILTASGKRLMVFGWWGLVRHPNYLGDILMAISWSLTCGFTHIVPWFYPIHLAALLIHREFRDEALNSKKYGKSWDEYCRRVPFRIFPKVF